MQRYRVSADHVHPDWRFIDHPVRVGVGNEDPRRPGLIFYASADRLGCSPHFKTQVESIRDLFLNSGCTNIRIRAETPEEEEKADVEGR